jgi:hypothetical protein
MKTSLVLLLSFASSLLAGDFVDLGKTLEENAAAITTLETKIRGRIKRITGLDASLKIERIEVVLLSDANIPYLNSRLKAKTGILVRFAPGKLKWSLPLSGKPDPYTRFFSVYLDSDATRVLAVKSRLETRSPDIHPEPSPESGAKQLSDFGNEVYLSFPMDDPAITFMQALEVTRHGGIGHPLIAHEIDGFYVMHSRLSSKPKPVWIINLRGLPPNSFNGDPYPAWQCNFARGVVDAMSGEWMFGCNCPRPY